VHYALLRIALCSILYACLKIENGGNAKVQACVPTACMLVGLNLRGVRSSIYVSARPAIWPSRNIRDCRSSNAMATLPKN